MGTGAKKHRTFSKIWLMAVFGVKAVLLMAQTNGWHFSHLSKADGLFSQLGVSVVEDKKNGYLWFGSTYAVQRFDGEEFVQIYPNKGEIRSLDNAKWLTEVLLFDSKGYLWFWEAGRIMRFSSATLTLDTFSTVQSGVDTLIDYYPSFYSLGMYEDSRGRIWMMSNSKGLQVFDSPNRRFLPVLKPPARGMRSIGHMVEDEEGQLWFNLNEKPARYNPETGELIFSGNNPDRNPLFDRTVSTVFKDSKGNLWWGGWRPLLKYSLSTGKMDSFPYQCNVSSMVEDRHGRLWFAIHQNQSIDYWDPSKNRFTRIEAEPWKANGLWLGDSGRQLHLDSKGNLWVLGTHYVNMFRPDDQIFFLFNNAGGDPNVALPNAEINDFYQTADGTIYVVYWNHHCPVVLLDSNFAIQKKFGKAFDPLFHNAAGWRIIEDSAHKIWVTQQGGLVTIYDPIPKTVRKLKPPELQGTAVERLIKDRRGDLWFGLWRHRGLARWDCQAKKFQHFDLSKSVNQSIVSDIVEDPRQDWLWLATDRGLLQFDKTTGQVVPHKITSKDKGDHILGMMLYEDSVLFLGHREGLFRFNIRTRKHEKVIPEGKIALPNVSNGMLLDAKKRIWYGYAGGIARYDPTTNKVTLFSLSESFQGSEFSGRLSYNRLRNGHFFVAFGNNFTIFDPIQLPEVSPLPQPTITRLQILGEHPKQLMLLDSSAVLRFQDNENNFMVHFSSMIFSKKDWQFSWRLKGLSDQWSEPTQLALANFTNVPPGNHTFEVKILCSDGRESPISRIYIFIKSPYWATWWFRLLCITALIGIFYAIFRYRELQRLKQEQIRTRIARDLHDEVGSTLSSISILSSTASMDTQKELEAMRNNIGDKARYALESMSDIVWSVNPENDSMQKVIARMVAYAAETLEQAGTELHVEVGEEVENLTLPMDKRKDLYLLFKEAIHNCVKYAHAKRVEVELRKEDNTLMLKVKDDGVGFEIQGNSEHPPTSQKLPSAGSLGGNGLKNMHSRAAAIGGRLNIESKKGIGTIIILKMPV